MLNLPNTLAFLRILMAPAMFLFLVERDLFPGVHESWLNYFAALIFVVASVTDFFDGFIARSWNQTTKLGEVLDPLADKMLMLAGFLGILALDRGSSWAVFLILSREFFITGLRVVAVGEGISVAASNAGKLKTFFQIFAVGFLIMDWPYADELLIAALILTIYSGIEYVRDYLKVSTQI